MKNSSAPCLADKRPTFHALRPTLIVEYCKYPVPGKVKTRLAKDLGDVRAAYVYDKLLKRVHSKLLGVKNDQIKLCTYFEDDDRISGRLKGADLYLKQEGDTLNKRLSFITNYGFKNSYGIVLHTGTDYLDISRGLIDKIVVLHNTYDVCFVPSRDGGYNIVSVKTSQDAEKLFEGMEFSNSAVLLNTVKNTQNLGMRYKILPVSDDIDDIADLKRNRSFSPISLSVVIPVYNDANNLRRCLETLLPLLEGSGVEFEVIVVDGGSKDNPEGVCGKYDVDYLESGLGRAVQMNYGASVALGRWLWFLHSDIQVTEKSFEEFLSRVKLNLNGWGYFRHMIKDASPFLYMIQKLNDWRARYWMIPFGDQGVFIHSGLFDRVGGFPEEPFLEDVILSKKLRKYSSPVEVKNRVSITKRHWDAHGSWKTTHRNWLLLYKFYYLRKRPDYLAKEYK